MTTHVPTLLDTMLRAAEQAGTVLRVVELEEVPRRIFPARVTHASVATAMLDAAESGRQGRVVIPLNA